MKSGTSHNELAESRETMSSQSTIIQGYWILREKISFKSTTTEDPAKFLDRFPGLWGRDIFSGYFTLGHWSQKVRNSHSRSPWVYAVLLFVFCLLFECVFSRIMVCTADKICKFSIIVLPNLSGIMNLDWGFWILQNRAILLLMIMSFEIILNIRPTE